jgi:hypothetical protein
VSAGWLPAPPRCGQATSRRERTVQTTTAIHYHVSLKQAAQQRRAKRSAQAKTLNDFRNSTCDYMNSADLYEYAWRPGHSMEWFLEWAKWRDPRGKNGTFSNVP